MSRSAGSSPRRDRSRGVTPVVGKTLEVALLLLLAALLTTALFGGVLPTYRTAAGAELADRTLVQGATAVESATPADPGAYERFERTRRVSVPDRIRGEPYVVRTSAGRLELDHPRAGVGGSVRPLLPANTTLAGSWRSDRQTRLRVRLTDDGTTVTLVGGDGG